MDKRTIQRALAAKGYYRGEIDGILGDKSWSAVNRALATDAGLPVGRMCWGEARQLIAVKQLILRDLDIEVGTVDGLMGPQTRYALEVWQDRMRDVTPSKDEVAHQPAKWPRQGGVPRFFGKTGGSQTMLECPYPMRLAWATKTVVSRFSIHAKAHDSAKRVLQGALDHYGLDGIKALRLDLFGGCLNVRKMRGGSAMSMHSWGIAIDIDPERNQLRWGADRAHMAHPQYAQWWELWEAEGWISLGRERDFDWMHVQCARL